MNGWIFEHIEAKNAIANFDVVQDGGDADDILNQGVILDEFSQYGLQTPAKCAAGLDRIWLGSNIPMLDIPL